MSDQTDGFIVAIRGVRISADAGRNGSPYMPGELAHVRFDDDRPGGIVHASAKRADETVFAMREEAESAVQGLIAKNAARARTERGFNADLARHLIPFEAGIERIGGYEILPRTQLLAERAEERRLAEAKVRAELALETAKAAAQQAVVDRIAAELKDAPAFKLASGEWVRHADEKGIQMRTRQDGTVVYRKRVTVDGRTRTSPSFEQLADAVAWEPGEQPAQTTAPMRAPVGIIADPEAAGLT